MATQTSTSTLEKLKKIKKQAFERKPMGQALSHAPVFLILRFKKHDYVYRWKKRLVFQINKFMTEINFDSRA
jgi:hypothetical protein